MRLRPTSIALQRPETDLSANLRPKGAHFPAQGTIQRLLIIKCRIAGPARRLSQLPFLACDVFLGGIIGGSQLRGQPTHELPVGLLKVVS